MLANFSFGDVETISIERHGPVSHDLTRLPLECPECHVLMSGFGTDTRICLTCDSRWEIRDSKWWFGGQEQTSTGDSLDSLKGRLKMYPNVYSALINIISPVYPHFVFEKRRIKKLMSSDILAIDVGSGSSRIMKGVVNIDLMPYKEVDVVARAERIPFSDASVDIVFSLAVLEHVLDPQAAIREIVRVLRPGGHAFVFVPFIQGFHSSPHDYQRYTRTGLEHALGGGDLRVVRTESFGPTSGLVWVLGEWLSIPLSLGIVGLQWRLAILLQVILSPLKFLDVLLRRMPGSDNISTGFLVIATKDVL